MGDVSNYSAVLTRIKEINPIKGKDRIVAAKLEHVFGVQVIVSVDSKVGDPLVYFPPDTQLSHNFVKNNNLYRVEEKGRKISGGYFDHNRRVKVQRFAGIPSEGFAVPPSHFDYLGGLTAKEGEFFDTVNNERVCRKYYFKFASPPTQTKKKTFLERLKEDWKKAVNDVIEKFNTSKYHFYKFFVRHPETPQLRNCVHLIPAYSELKITAKIHGTSAVTGLVKRTWFEKLWTKDKTPYKFIVGTRNVVLKDKQLDPYYKDVFRWNCAEKFRGKLRPGETVYYEIAGFKTNGEPIMEKQELDKLKKDYKDIEKYSSPMIYSYGCKPGECRIFIYRITQEIDGEIYELPFEKIQERALLHFGVGTVPLLETIIHDGNPENLLQKLEKYMSTTEFKPSVVDSTHIDEGVVVRVNKLECVGCTADPHAIFDDPRRNPGFKAYKYKSFIFGVLEGFLKERGVQDLEEIGAEILDENQT